METSLGWGRRSKSEIDLGRYPLCHTPNCCVNFYLLAGTWTLYSQIARLTLGDTK